MNESLIHPLIHALRQEEQALTNLMATFLAQEEALTKNRLSDLQQIIRQREDLIATVREIEKQRVECTVQLAIALGCEKVTTLSVIADRAGG